MKGKYYYKIIHIIYSNLESILNFCFGNFEKFNKTPYFLNFIFKFCMFYFFLKTRTLLKSFPTNS